MTRTRISLRINNDRPAGELIELARTAEQAGIDQLWVSNDLMLQSAPAILGALTQHTSRIGLGIGIMNPYSVHPSELAMTAATLQELSGGRFLLGLGAGSGEFLEWIGIAQPTPLTTTREALRAIRALLAGERPVDVPGAGPGWNADAVLRVPRPEIPVPLYIGAMSPRMLAFAGAEADGVLALHLPPEHLLVASAHVERGAREAGRDPGALDLPACVWLSLDEDQEAADRALALKLAYYGTAFSPFLLATAGLEPSDFAPAERAIRAGDEDAAVAAITPQMLRMGISGSPDVVVERCRELLAQGVRHLSFGPPLGPDPVRTVELLGEAVVPRIREGETA
ncbi:LLM class flavin-dependent oxidoreductase [Homoserinibacter sp. GY 40078]|uniref:LLM class flavin-dependent oxidoreductase n=1 Tax=Homoserinibacter sp. GY 40078 TaxID=2603275 RepID=UPI0011C909B1|nr:LLM class flavin-dependent oxidoreductase [Homoserinibacter sp. GY 40078]TXK19851.1 LLM class flavin-dependent oxidoreductase [Homoserinibacter sp. GY 40078]